MAVDFFPKTRDEYSQRTLSGAAISILSLALICWLGLSELLECARVETSDTIVPYGAAVPDAGALDVAPQLPINLDIHFPGLPCSDIALEITDESGGDALPYSSSVSKLRTGV